MYYVLYAIYIYIKYYNDIDHNLNTVYYVLYLKYSILQTVLYYTILKPVHLVRKVQSQAPPGRWRRRPAQLGASPAAYRATPQKAEPGAQISTYVYYTYVYICIYGGYISISTV